MYRTFLPSLSRCVAVIRMMGNPRDSLCRLAVATRVQVHQAFRVVWADHGDDISRQYAGTGALKSGFTRTGKRTTMGLLDDGVKSVTRYYLNTFQDGQKQDALDLASGSYRVESGAPSMQELPCCSRAFGRVTNCYGHAGCCCLLFSRHNISARSGFASWAFCLLSPAWLCAGKGSPFKPQRSALVPLAAAAVSVIWGILVMIRLILVRPAAVAAALDGTHGAGCACSCSDE